jgi:hypothetical protein
MNNETRFWKVGWLGEQDTMPLLKLELAGELNEKYKRVSERSF